MTDGVSDQEVAAAIDSRNAADIFDTGDVRDVIDELQDSFEQFWAEQMDLVEEGDLDLVHEGVDVLVFADHTGHLWGEEMGAQDVDGELATVAKIAVHSAADRHADYSWAAADPLVIVKPDDFEMAQHFVEAVINGLLSRGLSPGQAWGWYGVKIRGNSRNMWAHRCGYSDHSSVSEPIRKAEDKLY